MCVKNLSEQMQRYVAAAFAGIYVKTLEPTEAVREIKQVAASESWEVYSWDIDRGLVGGSGAVQPGPDPAGALRAIPELVKQRDPRITSTIVLLPNFNKFLGSVEVLQVLINTLDSIKAMQAFVVILAPAVDLPPELNRLFVVIDHALPNRDQLLDVAKRIAEDDEMPKGDDLEQVLDAAAGLTLGEAENAFALGIIDDGKLTAESIWELKSQAVSKNGVLSLHRSKDGFDGLGGLDGLKSWCKKALRKVQHTLLTRPRGILLLGVPGTGKSDFCKRLGYESGRPTLIMNVGELMGSLVGQSEANMKKALDLADAMAPCILMVDEVEKALSGVASSGSSDGGTTSRVFGTFLSWLSDHTSDVFVVCTSNDITKLPPEFSRAERFDAVWFLDLPVADTRKKIWDVYLKLFKLKGPVPSADGWTGAEIRACCRSAAMQGVGVAEAATQIVPVSALASTNVQNLRSWASGRCLDAESGVIYQVNRQAEVPSADAGRRLIREK